MQKIIAPFSEISTQNNSSNTIFYNIVGNFVPPEWRNLTSGSGKVLSKTSKQILSLIVSRLQSDKIIEKRELCELNETYYYFEQLIGVCQKRIRQCLEELEKSGYIKFSVNNIVKEYVKYRNIICISLIKNFTPYSKKISSEPEKSFQHSGNNFPPHNIIDNNISISKSRYKESSFEKTFFESNSFDLSDGEDSTDISEVASCDNEGLENKLDTSTLASPSNSHNKLGETGWLTKAKLWYKGKTLAEFHPLTEDDAIALQLRSKRDFNLNFINKLLLRLAAKIPDNRFYGRNAMLSYMTKALIYEMRQVSAVNNEGFDFGLDSDIKQREEYLSKIEDSKDVSLQAQLKKKIAGVFRPDIACLLLKSCRFTYEVGEVYQLKLIRDIELSECMQKTLLDQIRAVYGDKIKSLEIIPVVKAKAATSTNKTPSNNKENLEEYLEAQGFNDNTIWSKAKRCLLEMYGIDIYRSWFSNLRLIEENNETKQITLKPATSFIGDWIKNKYGHDLQMIFKSLNVSYEILRLNPYEVQ